MTVLSVVTCLFNLCAEHIMRNARLDELQAGIKRSRKNINNFGYVDDSTLVAESKEELKSLLMRVKEESERSGLKLNIKKKRKEKEKTPVIMVSGPITACQIEGKKVKIVTNFLFLSSKITVNNNCHHEIRR